MKNKIAIIESGFMVNYIQYFIKLCLENNIDFDLFTFYKYSNYRKFAKNVFILKNQYHPKKIQSKTAIEEEIKNLVDIYDYDYFLTDCLGLSFACNVFHNHSLNFRLSVCPNPLVQLILKTGHLKQLEHEKNYYKNCPKIIVVSEYMKKDFTKNCSLSQDKIIVAYPGTNNGMATCLPPQTISKTFTIGAVTCGFSTKGGYTIVKAIEHLKKKNPEFNLKLRIVNPNYSKQRFLKLYMKLSGLYKYVDFLPYQRNINKFYKTLDCLVCASRYEAFGRVVTEAMLNNIPVITGSNIGAADIIKDGENGFIFYDDKNRIQNLADKIEEVISKQNNLSKLTKNAYETAEQLSWENFAKTIFKGLSKNICLDNKNRL